jgi:N-acylneuraminate cytidylyltransferase
MNIAFIPARCGSKSIKFKNIKEFCGKPLIYWSLLALEKAYLVDEVYVASDCDEILNIVDSFKFKKVNLYKRDDSNAQDHSSTESVMLEFLQKKKLDDNDMFLLVQATSPTTTFKDINSAINKLREENKDSLLSVVREKKFFWNDDYKPINYE